MSSFFYSKYKYSGTKKKIDAEIQNKFQDNDEYATFAYCYFERKKPSLDKDIQDEYMEKIIMYGYIMVRFLAALKILMILLQKLFHSCLLVVFPWDH